MYYLYLLFFIFVHSLGLYTIGDHIVGHLNGGVLLNLSLSHFIFSFASIAVLQYLLLFGILTWGFTYGNYLLASVVINRFNKDTNPILLHICWAIAAPLLLVILNRALFTHTAYDLPDYFLLGDDPFKHLALMLLIAAPFATLLFSAFRCYKVTTSIITSIALVVFFTLNMAPTKQSLTEDKPNIILIGIDSLRIELIEDYMPFLNSQLAHTTRFTNTYTPFARTYPAWTSILTGRQPVNHGARYNLQLESMLSDSNIYLPQTLQAQGYQTLYASDERRFSNVGSTQGFEKVIGPRTGAADFLLGQYADYPLTNIINQFLISKWLFPELYANRAAAHSYQPAQFNNYLSYELNHLVDKPVFLAAHYCLAHWPYTYAGHKEEKDYSDEPKYPNNLRAIDDQIETLFNALEAHGLLKNSRIIFLSDHGESWGNVESEFTDQDGHALKISSRGHGASIINPKSQKVLLALKHFDLPTGSTQALASLMDISPTILDTLGLPIQKNHDGYSLLRPTPTPKEISFESGRTIFEPGQEDLIPEELAKKSLSLYQLQSNGRMRLREHEIKKMLQTKQYGLRIGDKAIFRGKLAPPFWKSDYLLLDYKPSKFTKLTSFSELTKLEPRLAERFCTLFSSSHAGIQQECQSEPTQP